MFLISCGFLLLNCYFNNQKKKGKQRDASTSKPEFNIKIKIWGRDCSKLNFSSVLSLVVLHKSFLNKKDCTYILFLANDLLYPRTVFSHKYKLPKYLRPRHLWRIKKCKCSCHYIDIFPIYIRYLSVLKNLDFDSDFFHQWLVYLQ